MTAVENQYFDIQPQQDNNNILFNDLVNVVPVAHPWTGMWHRERLEVVYWDKQRHWFRKRKWFKKVQLWRRVCWSQPEKEPTSTNFASWIDWEFTDEIIYEWHRWFLRTNQDKSRIKIYVQWFVNPEECTQWVYYPITAWAICDVTEAFVMNKDNKSDYYESWCWYSLPFAECAFDRFIQTWGIKYKEAWTNKHNPDWEWYLKIIKNEIEDDNWKVSFNYVWVLYNKDWKYTISNDQWLIRLNDSWMVVTNAWQVCAEIANKYKLPLNSIFIEWAMELQYSIYWNIDWCKWLTEVPENTVDVYIDWGITVWERAGNTLSFFTLEWVINISAYSQWADWEDFTKCFSIDSYPVPWTSSENNWRVITWATIYNNRIAYVTDDSYLWISWEWENQSWVPAWVITEWWDKLIWAHAIPSWITDVVAYWAALVLLWPHGTWFFQPDGNNWWWWLYEITDKSWYFNRWSWCYKDSNLFVARTNKDLYYLQWTSSYGIYSWNYSYYSQFINSHLRSLHRTHDRIHIDMTDNNTYLCIYDNDHIDKYSKILIQDRQYNFWYTWLINWARISRIKDDAYFWDAIYSNEWDTDNWKELIEIISATFWDETIEATKHFVIYKMAVWENSKITKKTTIEATITDSWLEHVERQDLTPVRYPWLLWKKDPWKVHSYDIWWDIETLWKKDEHTFQNEILKYSKIDTSNIYYDERPKYLWTYAPLVFKANRDGELMKLTAVARWTDNLEFWWFFIGYYQQDFDFWDIAESMITPSVLTYASEHQSHKMPAVEDPEVLWHF